jgi:hypothetical protein
MGCGFEVNESAARWRPFLVSKSAAGSAHYLNRLQSAHLVIGITSDSPKRWKTGRANSRESQNPANLSVFGAAL